MLKFAILTLCQILTLGENVCKNDQKLTFKKLLLFPKTKFKCGKVCKKFFKNEIH